MCLIVFMFNVATCEDSTSTQHMSKYEYDTEHMSTYEYGTHEYLRCISFFHFEFSYI